MCVLVSYWFGSNDYWKFPNLRPTFLPSQYIKGGRLPLVACTKLALLLATTTYYYIHCWTCAHNNKAIISLFSWVATTFSQSSVCSSFGLLCHERNTYDLIHRIVGHVGTEEEEIIFFGVLSWKKCLQVKLPLYISCYMIIIIGL